MEKFFSIFLMIAMVMAVAGSLSIGFPSNARAFETDTIATSAGDLKITFIGHASLIFSFGGRTIHVDPDTRLTDYASLPKADLVLLTHEHKDHCDPKALEAVRTDRTVVVSNEGCAAQVGKAVIMRNGETQTVEGVKIEAVPAYNLVHMRSEGVPYHPRGVGNGYVVTFGDKRIYLAGDTENIPEMAELKGIDVAFLPMNLPYTMTPEMTAAAARMVHPKILYPYHFGDTDTARIVELLKGTDIEVRIRPMK